MSARPLGQNTEFCGIQVHDVGLIAVQIQVHNEGLLAVNLQVHNIGLLAVQAIRYIMKVY